MAVDPESFRELFGSFPTSVAIVTALDRDGEPRGFTCNALSAVSIRPPLLLVCVDRASQTLAALEHSNAFVVHVLADGAQATSQRFAGKSADKFAALDWLPSEAANGAPVLTNITVAHAECTTVRRVEAGDHWIFIGRVERTETFARRPLLYQRRSYGVWDPVTRTAAVPG